MEKLLTELCEYVSEVTGLSLIVTGSLKPQLPNYLVGSYGLYELWVGKLRFLGVLVKEPEGFKPAAFEKHASRLVEAAGLGEHWCLIADDLPSYTRRRLIERQISFVLPGRQLHWPELGMAVQAWKSRESVRVSDYFKPATQAVVLHGLLEARGRGEGKGASVQALSERLGYTAMTVSRAFDELEAVGLGRVTRQGRERLLDFPDGTRSLWEQVRKYLRSPVRDAYRVKFEEPGFGTLPLAGESALAQRTMLTEPREPVFAVSASEWRELSKNTLEIPIQDEGTCIVQVWRYDPRLFVREGVVDPFSLYLSLQDIQDERVEMALDELMEQLEWL